MRVRKIREYFKYGRQTWQPHLMLQRKHLNKRNMQLTWLYDGVMPVPFRSLHLTRSLHCCIVKYKDMMFAANAYATRPWGKGNYRLFFIA